MDKFVVSRFEMVDASELKLGDLFDVHINNFGPIAVKVEKISENIVCCFLNDIVVRLDMISDSDSGYITEAHRWLSNNLIVQKPDFDPRAISFRLPTKLELYGDEENSIKPEFYNYRNKSHYRRSRCFTVNNDIMALNYLLNDKEDNCYQLTSKSGKLIYISDDIIKQFPEKIGICPVMEIHLSDNS